MDPLGGPGHLLDLALLHDEMQILSVKMKCISLSSFGEGLAVKTHCNRVTLRLKPPRDIILS